MTSPQPSPKPKTLLGSVTQAVRTVHARIDFSKLKLKPNARVPELWIQDAGVATPQVYPLLGDRYLVGRSSKSCDIIVSNPVVSQVHLSLSRDQRRQRVFTLQDENSTNGIYRGRRRITQTKLYHGDTLTLGPPELVNAVRVRYVDPPPWYALAARYTLYGMSGLATLIAGFVLFEWRDINVLPLPAPTQGPVVVLSRDGQTPLQPVRMKTSGDLPNLTDFGKYLPNAVIASEDTRYYWHLGVDPIGIARAVVTNVRAGEAREGASTLTQQIARSLFRSYVGTEDSAGRKLREAVVALKLETFYSKDFLLKTYLNRVYLGAGLYGFETASQFYFGKAAKDLTLSEAATLVGILPAPNRFNPVRDPETAEEYRNRVISRMAAMGMITPEEANRARRSLIQVSPAAQQELQGKQTIAPYFYSYVFEELAAHSPQLLEEGNLIIETSLDIQTQQLAEASLRKAVQTSGSVYGYSQGAIVTLNAKTGEILALVGGTNYQESQFNRASQARRQPGSTFKVFAYTAALEQGVPPQASYSCAPLNWGGQQFEGCHSGSGQLDLYTAIARSENAVALRVAQDVGLDKVVQMAKRMGINDRLNAVPGLVLGQSEVSVLEMTSAFGIFANRGVRIRPHAINRVLDGSDCRDRKNPQSCRVIYAADQDPSLAQKVISPQVAETMTSLLRTVVQSGTGRAAALGVGEAGKTGTTNDNVDLWFIGYIPDRGLSTGIWLGNDNNSATSGSSGQAAELWGNYMGQVIRR